VSDLPCRWPFHNPSPGVCCASHEVFVIILIKFLFARRIEVGFGSA
jgi:hypothetical protein